MMACTPTFLNIVGILILTNMDGLDASALATDLLTILLEATAKTR